MVFKRPTSVSAENEFKILKCFQFLQSYFEKGTLAVPSTWDNISKLHLESLEPIVNKFLRPAMALESQVVHPQLEYKGYVDCVTQYVENDDSAR